MKFIILHILCEGQTEARFAEDVLAPFLRQYGIYVKTILLLTSGKKGAHGGLTAYAKAENDIRIMLKTFHDTGSERHLFTTMFDYYALPHDFPAYLATEGLTDVRRRIAALERALADEVGDRRFIPYIQLHEFEALLFTDIMKLQGEYPLAASDLLRLKQQTDLFGDPEMINGGPATAPSKRIIAAIGRKYNYNKVKSGPKTAAAIGIEAIMSRCSHFREWIADVQSLADSLSSGT